MSKQDLRRIEVLTEVLAGQRTTISAASILNVSVRQAQHLFEEIPRRSRDNIALIVTSPSTVSADDGHHPHSQRTRQVGRTKNYELTINLSMMARYSAPFLIDEA
jgi:hypothetical protein